MHKKWFGLIRLIWHGVECCPQKDCKAAKQGREDLGRSEISIPMHFLAVHRKYQQSSVLLYLMSDRDNIGVLGPLAPIGLADDSFWPFLASLARAFWTVRGATVRCTDNLFTGTARLENASLRQDPRTPLQALCAAR